MNMEADHVLTELVTDRKRENQNWQPNKVMQDAIDYVSRLPKANSSAVINTMRE